MFVSLMSAGQLLCHTNVAGDEGQGHHEAAEHHGGAEHPGEIAGRYVQFCGSHTKSEYAILKDRIQNCVYN